MMKMDWLEKELEKYMGKSVEYKKAVYVVDYMYWRDSTEELVFYIKDASGKLECVFENQIKLMEANEKEGEKNMYLVMVNEKPTGYVNKEVTGLNSWGFAQHNYQGESTRRIKENLETEAEDSVIVTADSRLLKFSPSTFQLDNVFIYDNKRLVKLKEATKRNLRDGHDLMKLYDAGEFDASTAPVATLT